MVYRLWTPGNKIPYLLYLIVTTFIFLLSIVTWSVSESLSICSSIIFLVLGISLYNYIAISKVERLVNERLQEGNFEREASDPYVQYHEDQVDGVYKISFEGETIYLNDVYYTVEKVEYVQGIVLRIFTFPERNDPKCLALISTASVNGYQSEVFLAKKIDPINLHIPLRLGRPKLLG